MIFPDSMISDIRKAHASGTPIKKREIRFAGEYVGEPRTVPCPGPLVVNDRLTVPRWCSCCGEELKTGEDVIEQVYSIYPNRPEMGAPFPSWFHIQKCKHAGGI